MGFTIRLNEPNIIINGFKAIKEKVETQTTDVILKSFMLLEAKKQVGELATHERVVRAALGDVIIEREGVEVFDALI